MTTTRKRTQWIGSTHDVTIHVVVTKVYCHKMSSVSQKVLVANFCRHKLSLSQYRGSQICAVTNCHCHNIEDHKFLQSQIVFVTKWLSQFVQSQSVCHNLTQTPKTIVSFHKLCKMTKFLGASRRTLSRNIAPQSNGFTCIG